VSAQLGPRIVAALLTKIEEAGLVERETSAVKLLASADSIEERTRGLAGQFETLRRQDARRLDALAEYAKATDCRASFLRQYFGEDNGQPCGLCDVCRGLPERPSTFFAPIARPEPPPRKPRRRRRRRRHGQGAAPPQVKADTSA
jgi:superfamily II DNA helicase RecQ